MKISQRSGLKKLAFSLGLDFFKTQAKIGKRVKEWYFVTNEFNRLVFQTQELRAVKSFLLEAKVKVQKAQFQAELKEGVAKREAFIKASKKETIKEPSLFDCLEIA